MKKVLITGANGYLGAKLSKYFLENGFLVDGVCYPKVPIDWHCKNNFNQLLSLDLRDAQSIDNISDTNYDTVIHLVSLDHHQSDGDPYFVSSVNVMPTWSLLKKFSEKNNLKKIIYFSTIQVYGRLPIADINEDNANCPQNIYGLTHLLSEQICNFYNQNSSIHCINVRLSNSYGSPVFKENNCWWLVVNDLCKTAFQYDAIYLKSDGSPQRDFIHNTDVCKAVEVLVNNACKNSSNNIFHISSGKTNTILEIAHMVKTVFNERYKKQIKVFLPDNSISINSDNFKCNDRFSISNEKIKNLGFIPDTDLTDGIIEIFEYLEKNYA